MINHIHLENMFWGRMTEYLMTFGNHGLPKGIHYTFAFGDNGDFVDFHVTKENGQYPKPKIVIAQVRKEDLEELLLLWTRAIYRARLKEVDISKLKEENPGTYFVSLKGLDEEALTSTFQDKMISCFASACSVKGKKLEIKPEDSYEFMNAANAFLESGIAQEFIEKNVTDLSNLTEHGDAAFGVIGEDVVDLIHLYGKWYTSKRDFTPKDMLNAMIGKSLADLIVKCTAAAVKILAKPSIKTRADLHLPGYVPLILRKPIDKSISIVN
ncbi:MAG: hypothetical protein POELPBGB_01070 [Bacteroidia bacterium]|nr:hypothetical protein [Bacteroidia bacterium]